MALRVATGTSRFPDVNPDEDAELFEAANEVGRAKQAEKEEDDEKGANLVPVF